MGVHGARAAARAQALQGAAKAREKWAYHASLPL